MRPPVRPNLTLRRVPLVTHVASVRFHAGVKALMDLQLDRRGKAF